MLILASVYLLMRKLWLVWSVTVDYFLHCFDAELVNYKRTSNFSELISPYQPSRSLRSSNQLLLAAPRADLTNGQHAFAISSPIISNTIPLSVSDAPSAIAFKGCLKSFYCGSLVSFHHLVTSQISVSSYTQLCCALQMDVCMTLWVCISVVSEIWSTLNVFKCFRSFRSYYSIDNRCRLQWNQQRAYFSYHCLVCRHPTL